MKKRLIVVLAALLAAAAALILWSQRTIEVDLPECGNTLTIHFYEPYMGAVDETDGVFSITDSAEREEFFRLLQEVEFRRKWSQVGREMHPQGLRAWIPLDGSKLYMVRSYVRGQERWWFYMNVSNDDFIHVRAKNGDALCEYINTLIDKYSALTEENASLSDETSALTGTIDALREKNGALINENLDLTKQLEEARKEALGLRSELALHDIPTKWRGYAEAYEAFFFDTLYSTAPSELEERFYYISLADLDFNGIPELLVLFMPMPNGYPLDIYTMESGAIRTFAADRGFLQQYGIQLPPDARNTPEHFFSVNLYTDVTNAETLPLFSGAPLLYRNRDTGETAWFCRSVTNTHSTYEGFISDWTACRFTQSGGCLSAEALFSVTFTVEGEGENERITPFVNGVEIPYEELDAHVSDWNEAFNAQWALIYNIDYDQVFFDAVLASEDAIREYFNRFTTVEN